MPDHRGTTSRRATRALAVAVAVVQLVGCGGDDDATSPPASRETTPSTSVAGGSTTTTTPSGAPTAAQQRAAAMCAATPASGASPAVAADAMVETSGVVESPVEPGVLWAHNDSGDAARLFAIGLDGAHLGELVLHGVEVSDVEDLAATATSTSAAGERDASFLVGDIGDNAAARDEVRIHRVAATRAPGPGERVVAEAETLHLRYPELPADAEVLLADPRTGDLVIVTKDLGGRPAEVFSAPGERHDGDEVVLERRGAVDLRTVHTDVPIPDGVPDFVVGFPWLATGGDVSAAGDVVLLRTYGAVWVFPREPDTPLWSAFDAEPCVAPSVGEPQGEAVAVLRGGSGYLTISEGRHPPIHRFVTTHAPEGALTDS